MNAATTAPVTVIALTNPLITTPTSIPTDNPNSSQNGSSHQAATKNGIWYWEKLGAYITRYRWAQALP